MVYVIILIVSALFYLILMKHNRDLNNEIFGNPEYSIGVVTKFSGAKNGIGVPGAITVPARPSSVKYKYAVDGLDYENRYISSTFKIPLEGVKVGEKYLVVYLKTDPQKSRMLFEYPIKDSSDFEKQISAIRLHPSN